MTNLRDIPMAYIYDSYNRLPLRPLKAYSTRHRYPTLDTGLAGPSALQDPSLAIPRCPPNGLTQDDSSASQIPKFSSFLTPCREAESWAQDNMSAF